MKALVLSGGGSLGAFQVGVIKYLASYGHSFDLFVGISVGAINAAHLAMFPSFEIGAARLVELWSPLTTGHIHRRWFPFGYLHALWKLGARNTSPLREIVERELNPERLRKGLVVGAVAIETGEYRTWTEKDPKNIQRAVVASSALPVFLEAQRIDGLTWVDGGARNVTPLKDAIDRGADEIVVVTTFPYGKPSVVKTPSNVIGVGLGTFQAMLYEIMVNDIKHASLVNELIKAGARDQFPQYKPVAIDLVQPIEALDADPMEWDPAATARMIEQGYNDAKEYLG